MGEAKCVRNREVSALGRLDYIVIIVIGEMKRCLYYRGVRNTEVSTRAGSTV